MSLKRTLPSTRKLRVCIIGAGTAGLRVADQLLRHRECIDVTVLEARGRVGGRVAQGIICGRLVDLGPNWIHGTIDNPIMKLAEQTGTILHDWDGRQLNFDEDGSRLSEEETNEATTGFWDSVDEAFKYSRENSPQIPASQSLLDFITALTSKKYTSLPPPLANRARLLLLQESQTWGSFIGGITAHQSLRFMWMESGMAGESPFVASTYAAILNLIARAAVEADVVRLEREVIKIVSVEGSVKVCTRGGEEEKYDEVVVTTPLGWLKRHHRGVFEPELPGTLVSAIDAIGYGNLDKVYITFSSPFWEPSNSASNPKSDTHTPIGNTQTSALPSFIHWLHPNYSQTTNPSSQNQSSMNLALLPPSTSLPTLLFYISGPTSTLISSFCTLAPLKKRKALIDFFKPYYSLLPHYSLESEACIPVDILATDWTSDKFAGWGSYSNFPVGLEMGHEDVRVLRDGVLERRLWVAGEHVAPVEHAGTVAGAWLSGEHVAGRMLEMYGIDSKAETVG